ncbi:uncharacterized protein M6B38_109200 [Iris pallida]|uniref:Uncharacterized protein n=1 Tax=Iris pallida TaxID=29817 RepID=A0AAX6EGE0_IRIPA|nr:uncharacterized protein M6B38_109200 [Iris pallida]
MLFAVEGGGFFSSSATGYSKGLALLLLGQKPEERPTRVTPWNHYRLVDRGANTDTPQLQGRSEPPPANALPSSALDANQQNPMVLLLLIKRAPSTSPKPLRTPRIRPIKIGRATLLMRVIGSCFSRVALKGRPQIAPR